MTTVHRPGSRPSSDASSAGQVSEGRWSILHVFRECRWWAVQDSNLRPPACHHLHVRQLKEPQYWKPQTHNFYHRRLHLLALLLLNTGCRISEALHLRVRDIDLDDLLVTLGGKGRKERVVPFSFALRQGFFRYIRDQGRRADSLLLAARAETTLSRDNVRRDVKQFCKQLGFEPPPRTLHAFRHTFAVNYVRRGGSVFHLQKVLGHSTLEMTRRYANLVTADL